MDQKIKLLKKQIEDEEKNNIINKNNNNMNENNNKATNSQLINNNNNDTPMETEKDIYLKTKEKNNKLTQFIEELNKLKNNESNKLENLYNMDEKYLMEILSIDGIDMVKSEEKEMIGFINDYMNLLN